MNEKVLRILEFNKVVDKLASFAQSPLGREACRRIHPSCDAGEIDGMQKRTAAAVTRILRKERASISENAEIRPLAKTLSLGGVLSINDFLAIADQLECAARVRNYGLDDDDEYSDELTPLFEELNPVNDIKREIRRCISGPDTMDDNASPALSKIRKEIHSCEARIHEKMNSYLSGSSRSYLQDPVITIRDGHYCIPVKAEYKSQIPGVIHDQSATGSTLFIEPSAAIEIAGKIKQLEAEAKEEIERILRALSEESAPYFEDFINNQKILTKLDFIFARAELALDMNATEPVFNTDKVINIKKGRHPLLDKKNVVPIDIRLGEDFDLLIVTGPNTGGKTVSLKTIGLLTLMGQSGLHIPAASGSSLSIFRNVYADIGDEQSIEQSLSTFSAHMTNIVSVLRAADEDSLCLFDELCSGTDPVEGAALAISILTFLHDRGIRTMATTHYSELKLFALSTDYVQNACCEFDVKTLSPTYKLLIGIPGKSNAFAISKKLGLSDEIIEGAKEHITKDSESFEDVLAGLEKSRLDMERDRLTMDQYKRESQSLKDSLKAKQEKLDDERDRIIREAREEARNILQEAKDYADETIRNINKHGNGHENVKELEKTRQNLNKKISDKNTGLGVQKNKSDFSGLKDSDIRIGMSVKIVSMGLKGTVSTLPDHKGNLFVTCGIIRTQTNIRDLVQISDGDTASMYETRKGPKNTKGIAYSKSLNVSGEINLLGKTVDEAIAELDKYLDDAYLAHMPSVRIVHGKGTGALRNGIHSHLKGLRIVDSFRLGEFGEGDAGVTIVTFK